MRWSTGLALTLVGVAAVAVIDQRNKMPSKEVAAKSVTAKEVFLPVSPAHAAVTPQEVATTVPEEVLFKYHELPAEEMPINRKEQKCLGSIIHGEADNQTKLGKLGVGFALKNRKDLNRADFGGITYCGVANLKAKVYKTNYIRWQFDGAKNPPRLISEETNEEMEIAADIIRGRVTPEGWMKQALYFKAPYAKGPGSNWFITAGLPYLGLIGGHGKVAGHQFYGEKETAEPNRALVAESQPPPVVTAAVKKRPKVVQVQHKKLAQK